MVAAAEAAAAEAAAAEAAAAVGTARNRAVAARGMGASASTASILAPPGGWWQASAPASEEYQRSMAASVRERERARGHSCSEYLSWRRQVNDLISLPPPVRGVPSSASWGLLPEVRWGEARRAPAACGSESAADAPPPAAPSAGVGAACSRQPPATDPGRAFGSAGYGYGVRPRRSSFGGRCSEGGAASAVESEFAQHAAELQDEVDDLLSDLTVHLSARGASGF